MKLIVADVAGHGAVVDPDEVYHELDDLQWTEADVRSRVMTGEDGYAWVRYRDDGRTVDLGANAVYEMEYVNDDVVDLRFVHSAVDELIAAMDGIGTDEDRLYRALDTVAGNRPAIEAVEAEFVERTGRTLQSAFEDELSASELDRAMAYLR
jgi:hypothetical protein